MSTWAQEAVERVNELGLMTGKGNLRFDPKGNVTRAEMAKMVYMLLNHWTRTPFITGMNGWNKTGWKTTRFCRVFSGLSFAGSDCGSRNRSVVYCV
ncbi:S-layer homology domain-containing protein [Paenibacillus sp. JTLBN-2024]